MDDIPLHKRLLINPVVRNRDVTFGSACTSTVTSATPNTFSLAKLEELIASIPPEPYGEFMRSQGKPPGEWVLVLPDIEPFTSTLLPNYVQLSPMITTPVFVPSLRPGWGELSLAV